MMVDKHWLIIFYWDNQMFIYQRIPQDVYFWNLNFNIFFNCRFLPSLKVDFNMKDFKDQNKYDNILNFRDKWKNIYSPKLI